MRALFHLTAMALMAAASTVAAQEERAIDHFAGVGVRAMGMGGAFVGVADDFTALYWNPAGLAQIDHREVHVAFLRNSRTGKSALGDLSTSSSLNNTRFGSLGVVFPYPVYRGSLVFAAGFNRIKDFDWSLRQRGFEGDLWSDHAFRHEGGLSLTALAGAVDVSPAVSLGAAMGFVSGEDDAVNEFAWTDSLNLFQERLFWARDTFADEYESTFYASLGAMIRTPRQRPRFRLGATLTYTAAHEIDYVFRGVLDGYDLVEKDDGSRDESSPDTVRDSYKLSIPLEYALGASYAPVDGLLLAGSLHVAEWEQSEYEGEDDSQLRAYTSFEDRYRNVVRYHLGAEWQVPAIALDLRAGFYTDPLPFVGPPPIRFVQDRRFLTLGAGLLVDEVVQVDAAWTRGSFEQVEDLDGKELAEKGTISRLFAALAYRF